jgi:hypothetical protein
MPSAAERGYASRWWGTYRQISELGGQVRRGETSVQVVFWKQAELAAGPGDQAPVADAGHVRAVPLLRAFRVFNAEQADDSPARYRAAETAGPELAGRVELWSTSLAICSVGLPRSLISDTNDARSSRRPVGTNSGALADVLEHPADMARRSGACRYG